MSNGLMNIDFIDNKKKKKKSYKDCLHHLPNN